MSETGIRITVIGVATILSAGLIHYRYKQASFDLWVEQFEAVMESKVPEEDKDLILRDIYTQDVTIRQAIILYNEAKNA